MKKDTILGISMTILSAVMIRQADMLPRGSRWDLLGPATYPKYVSRALLVLSILLVLSSLRGGGKRAWDRSGYVLPGATFALLVSYVAVLPTLGFIASTLLFLLILQFILSPGGKKPWMSIGLTSVLFTLGIYYVAFYLNVQLPAFSLF